MYHFHEAQQCTYGDGEVIATGEFGDFAHIPETCSHDNGLVAVLLVVVEDGLYALDTWVLLLAVVLLSVGLVPVKNTTNEGRDEECAGFGGGDGLWKREHKSQVAVDAVLGLQNVRSLDALPS